MYFKDVCSKYKKNTVFIADHITPHMYPPEAIWSLPLFSILTTGVMPLCAPLNVHFKGFDIDSLDDPGTIESHMLKKKGKYLHPKYADRFRNNFF